jgi:Tfp pilus assembly protein PilN
MPFINLIEEQRQAVRKRERQLRVMVLGVLGIAALAFLTAGFFTFEAVRLRMQIGELQAKKTRLQPTMDALASAQEEEGLLGPRIMTLESAVEDTGRWTEILAYLALNTPDNLTLNALRCSPATATEPVTVSFQGLSANQETVGAYIVRLEANKELVDTQLRFTQEQLDGAKKSVQFEVAAVLEGTIPPMVDPNAPVEEGA